MAMIPGDQIVTLPHGERWFLDGFAVLPHPGGLLYLQCDMSRAQAAVAALRERGLQATYTHVFVRAAALALQRVPRAHEVVCGYQRLRPGRVDVGLSVAGQTSYAPVMVLPGVETRPLPELVPFVNEGAKRTRKKEVEDLAGMRRIGWVIPFGFLRRFILRALNGSFWFRRKLIGTFQITCLTQVDFVMPCVFYSGCALGVGRVKDRVVAENGQPVVRPTAWLSVAFDHRSMDGVTVGDFIRTLAEILESDELLREAQDPARLAAAAVAEHAPPALGAA